MATRIKTIFKTATPIAACRHKGANWPCKVHGAVKTTSLTKPNLVANQAIVAKTIGAKIKGIIKIGFKTIGTPKITGSLILKIDGAKIAFPSFEPYSDFARKANNIAKPIVAPAPPIQINHW